MTSRSVVRFGIVGTGRMAVRMAQSLSLLEGGQIVAVASGSPERAKRFAEAFGIPRAHEAVAALLADESVDVVYVANATAEHAGTTLLALKAGKSVLCEKPLATGAKESLEIGSAARESGCLVMEAMWTLFLPAYQRFSQLVASQRSAGPLHLYADFGYPISAGEQQRLVTPGRGAGVLLDRGVYPLALALKLFGAVRRIDGCVNLTADGVDEHAALHLLHEAGDVSQIAVSLRVLLQNRAAVSSASGLVELEPPVIGAESVRSFAHRPAGPAADPLVTAGMKAGIGNALRRRPELRRLNRLRQRGHVEHQPYGADPFLPMLGHFCEQVRAGKTASEVMPPGLSTAVLDLVDRARELPGSRPPVATTPLTSEEERQGAS